MPSLVKSRGRSEIPTTIYLNAYSVAVDSNGNVYIADSNSNSVKEWLKANGTVITLVSSGLNNPTIDLQINPRGIFRVVW